MLTSATNVSLKMTLLMWIDRLVVRLRVFSSLFLLSILQVVWRFSNLLIKKLWPFKKSTSFWWNLEFAWLYVIFYQFPKPFRKKGFTKLKDFWTFFKSYFGYIIEIHKIRILVGNILQPCKWTTPLFSIPWRWAWRVLYPCILSCVLEL